MSDIDENRSKCENKPLDHAVCELCGQPIDPAKPYVDFRWGDHDCCVVCSMGHDEPTFLHPECADVIHTSGQKFAGAYFPDVPWDALLYWALPILWRARWDPERVTVEDAIRAYRFVSHRYARRADDWDVAEDENPFVMAGDYWDSLSEFKAKAMPAIARSLGLDDEDAQYLPCLLVRGDVFRGWTSDRVRHMTHRQIVNRVHACRRNWMEPPHIGTYVEPRPSTDIWSMVMR